MRDDDKCGKNRQITEPDLLAAGKQMGLSAKTCKNVLEQTKRIVADWKQYADKCGIREQTAGNILKIMKQENS